MADERVSKAFEQARFEIDRKHQESTKVIEGRVKEVQEKTYKRLEKET